MLTQNDLATPTVLAGWLRDLALTPTPREDGLNNWNLEFTITGSSNLIMNLVNPKTIPRAVMMVCGMSPGAAHLTSFQNKSEEVREAFWKDLRRMLSREFVEFQLEGIPVLECPKVLRVSAVRFDDGLTLDSFSRTLSSVCKACSDAIVFFSERLGDPNAAPAGGEFAFKKSATQ
jgi:hypothetical protein